jgi:hypothetical protein
MGDTQSAWVGRRGSRSRSLGRPPPLPAPPTAIKAHLVQRLLYVHHVGRPHRLQRQPHARLLQLGADGVGGRWGWTAG